MEYINQNNETNPEAIGADKVWKYVRILLQQIVTTALQL